MRLLGVLLMGVILLSSCKEETEEVSFRMKAEGFAMEGDPDPYGYFGAFSHVIHGGVITFEGEQRNYVFDLRGIAVEDFTFRLPPGSYRVKAGNSPASLYGQRAAAYSSQPFDVLIDQQTDTISLELEVDCSLVLVRDDEKQLDQGAYMIERHSYAHGFFYSYPLIADEFSGLYYTYFRPDTLPSDPTAFIWFYDGVPGQTEGGIPTYDMEIGHHYHITVLE